MLSLLALGGPKVQKSPDDVHKGNSTSQSEKGVKSAEGAGGAAQNRC